MYKMIIVDDNFYDRDDALSIVNWDELFVKVTETFSNAIDAIEKMQEYKPDIILTDIQMPKMTGMEFIKAAKEINPCVKVVIMSCYSEFEYAREALKLDVAAYITKPLQNDEISNVFGALIAKMNEETELAKEKEEIKKRLQESFPILKERFIRSFILEGSHDEEALWNQMKYFNIPIKKGIYQVLVMEIDDLEVLRNLSMEQKQLIEIKVSNIVEKCFSNYSSSMEEIIVIQVDAIHFIILFNVTAYGFLINGDNTAVQLSRKIMEQIRCSGLPEMTLVLGKAFGRITETHLQYKECLNAMRHKFFVGKGHLLNIDELKEGEEAATIDLDTLKSDIRMILLSNQPNQVMSFMAKYFSGKDCTMSEHSVKDLTYSIIICVQLVMAEINLDFEEIFTQRSVVWKKLIEFETILDIQQWVKNILFSAQTWIADKNSLKNRKVVEEVRKYIEEYLDQELTVQNIADKVFFSPNYLNSLFQHETGETIPQYIVRVRMEKAKKLLLNTNMKLYEIVEEVGYKHTAYFNSLFKSCAGVTPKEYREGKRR